jgi:branched-chain amino acid transport system permease protein
METFIQFFINGIFYGCLLAIVAMGFALVFNTVSIMHVAHGATFVVGAYLAWGLIAELGLPIWLGIIITFIGCGILGILMELAIYRPIRRTGGTIASFLLASIGLTWVIQNICALIAGTAPQFLGKEWKVIYNVGDVYFCNMDIILVVGCIMVFGFFIYFLNHTSIGISIKAVASNPKLAAIWGASIDKVSLIVILVASLTVVPASLVRTISIGIAPFEGFNIVTLGLIAYIIGGIGSTMGAGFAGLGLGIITSLVTQQISNLWVPLFVFSIVYIFMWARPKGLFGKKIWTYEV